MDQAKLGGEWIFSLPSKRCSTNKAADHHQFNRRQAKRPTIQSDCRHFRLQPLYAISDPLSVSNQPWDIAAIVDDNTASITRTV